MIPLGGGRVSRNTAAAGSAKIIFTSFSIILPKIVVCLHLNEGHIFRTRFFDAVQGTFGDVYKLSRYKHNRCILNRNETLGGQIGVLLCNGCRKPYTPVGISCTGGTTISEMALS